MSVLVGGALGIGLVLIASAFLWRDTRSRSERPRAGRLRCLLNRSGLERVPESVFLALCACGGLILGALAAAFVGVLAIAGAAAVVGAVLPVMFVRWRGTARRRANQRIWPDAVDHLVSAVRSGIALPDAVSTLAHAGPETNRFAFAEFESRYRATGSFGVSLDALKETLADPTADRILETLRMSREVGGSDLVRVLRSLSSYLRDEAAIKAEVEARQSWVMNAAKLGVAAPWVVLVLLASRPEAAMAYNTGGGTALILGGLFVSVIAYRAMVAVGRLPEERRWFA